MSRNDGPFDLDADDDYPAAPESYDDDGYEYEDDVQPDEPVTGRTRLRRRQQPVDSESLLQRVVDIVSSARSLPLSASVSINRDEVLDLLEEVQERLPDEIREARWLLKEREEYLAKMQADGDEILDAARAHAERMVQRTEVVKAAEHRARRIVEGAQAEARRLRLECEDFCDQKLAGFEIVLERTLKTVEGGRQKLQTTGLRHQDNDDDGGPPTEAYRP
ncbi:MAG: hypothetical protein KF906_11305 [Actinobacteria bacterium]|nr:hypothetical protein [Actinomycetota bacterium]